MRNGTHRTLLLALIICLVAIIPAFAEDDATDLGTLYMAGSVATGTGVDIPEEATSIGNLVIEYSLDSSSWTYTSLADVVIDNLGQEPGTLFMRASYYGNEPEDYYCAVAFKSDGWTVVDGSGRIDAYNLDSSRLQRSRYRILGSDLCIQFGRIQFGHIRSERNQRSAWLWRGQLLNLRSGPEADKRNSGGHTPGLMACR